MKYTSLDLLHNHHLERSSKSFSKETLASKMHQHCKSKIATKFKVNGDYGRNLLLSIFLPILILILFCQNALAINSEIYPELSKANYVFLIDQDTKEVLLERNADEKIAPSSMTKLMTAYVIFSQLKKGKLNLLNKCLIGKEAYKKSGSTMFLNYGDIVTIDQLITGLLVVSGNDAAIALAEISSGSIEAFANLMNQTAIEIGLKNSHFMNPHGLNQIGHFMSIRDLGMLTIKIRQDFPEYTHYFSTTNFTYGNITQHNRNPLLKKDYEGVTGMKTGHTNEGGYGIVGTVTRGSRRLVGVTNEAKTPRQREKIITELFDYGFNNYQKITLFNKNYPITKVKVWMGEKNSIDIVSNQDIAITIPRDKTLNDLEVKINYKGPLYTPIAAGSKVATLTIKVSGKKVREVSLFAKENVDKAGYFKRIIEITKYKLNQFFNII